MRIGFFGGSFDPPHRGHLAIAGAALRACGLDKVLLAPAGQQPLKPDGAQACFEDRLAMVSLLCEESPLNLEPSDLDAPRSDGQPNYTIDTLTRLRQEHAPQDSLLLLVGADAFLDLPRWREPEALLAAVEWIVVSRPGIADADLRQAVERLAYPSAAGLDLRERVHLLTGIDDPASATEIRELLRTGQDCSSLLTPGVLGYIRSHGLYGT